MRGKLKFIVTSCLIILLLGFLYQLKRSSVLRERYQEQIEDLELSFMKEKNYQNNLILSAFQINLPISRNDEIILKDSIGGALQFSDITIGKPKLFLRFTDRHCDACYNFAIKKLKIFGNVIGFENIVLLVSFEGANTHSILAEQYHFKFKVYEVERQQLSSFPYEGVNSPYIFISKDSSTLTGFFIPDKALPELTDRYFEQIKEFLLYD